MSTHSKANLVCSMCILQYCILDYSKSDGIAKQLSLATVSPEITQKLSNIEGSGGQVAYTFFYL